MRKVLAWIFSVLGLILVIATIVSLIHSNRGWIQVLKFPRVLSLLAIAFTALGCMGFARRGRAGLLVALAAAAALQLREIYPYVAFAPNEMVETNALGSIVPRSCFTALGLNVLQRNRDYAPTVEMIARERPDILLLLETDRPWVDALAPVLVRYPHQVLRASDNTYGMVFATMLAVDSAYTENTTDQHTPTVYARMTTRDGQAFHYTGLHPRPPTPGHDTDLRDRKIARAALQLAGRNVPAIAMGDFNDVPWSRTTRVFKQVGGYLDPRIGRGTFPTFPATLTAIGWPLDQVFATPDFAFRWIRVLEDVGSDHRPLMAELCLSPNAAPTVNASPEALDRQARRAARSMTAE